MIESDSNFVGPKQAFLNIEVARKHRDFLRFLWFEDYSSLNYNVIVCRFSRLVFGLTSSPFVLNGTIRHQMCKFMEFEKEFVLKFLNDLYVDDTTSGCQSVEEGMKRVFLLWQLKGEFV